LKYRRFEELPAWNAAIELAVGVFGLSGIGCLQVYGSLRNQIERAAVSVSNNIAEGFERGTRGELLSFLCIHMGRLPGLSDWSREILDLKGLSANITHQLNAWLDALKSSEGVAPRHKSQETRRVADTVRKRDEFLEHLRQVPQQARPENDSRPPDVDPPGG